MAPAAWLAGGAGERWPLNDTVTRLGSALDNDIVVAGLAPQHAEIRRESDRYLIYDLGSRRTWVNDAQVAAVHMLKDGFRLKLGQADFQVSIPATNPASTEQR
jgi:predicted component of type VI protein secretion system